MNVDQSFVQTTSNQEAQELTNSNIQRMQANLQLIIEQFNEMNHQMWHSQAIYYLKNFIFPTSLLITNFLCILDMLYQKGNQDYLQQNSEVFFICFLTYFVGVMLIFEFINNIFQDKSISWYKALLNYSRAYELINIYEFYLYRKTALNFNYIEIILHVLRAGRLNRLKESFYQIIFNLRKHQDIQLVNYNLFIIKYQKKQKQNDIKQEKSQKSRNELNQFLKMLVFDIINGVFVQSTILLALNQLFNNNQFSCNATTYDYGDVDCINTYYSTIYFVLVSLSTIGYGDISPQYPQSRLLVTILILINVTLMSKYISRLIELIYQLSPYVQKYFFTDHIVIIGNIPDAYLIRFLEELLEFGDKQRQLEKTKNKYGIKIIIVGKNEPNYDLLSYLTIFNNNNIIDDQVVYLMADIYRNDTNWYDQAGIKECKTLFAFSQKGGQNIIQEDIDLAFVTRKIKNRFSHLHCFMVLQSQYKQQIQDDTLFKDIRIISSTECNEAIMGFSIEKSGFSTFIQHLLRQNINNIPQNVLSNLSRNAFESHYIKNMEQEIYQIELGEQFVGMTFQQIAQLFYFTGFQLEGRDISCVDQGMKVFQEQNLATLIAIKRIDYDLKVNILFNPQDFTIQKGDIGYLICSNYQVVLQCQHMTMENSLYIQCQKNLNKLRLYKRKYIQEEQSNLLNEWFQTEKLINEKEATKSVQNICDSGSPSMIKSQQKNKHSNSFQFHSQRLKKMQTVLNFNHLEYPQIEFRNHIIIFGTLQQFSRILDLLKNENERTSILFTEEKFNEVEWNKILFPHNNIYYIQGEFHNFNHIIHLKIANSYSVLVLSNQSEGLFQDSQAICLGRFISEYFDQKKILIELRNDHRINFFKKNPNIYGINQVKNPFLWPAFQQGNIHLSSCLFGLLARCLFDPDWLKFLEQLIHPNDQTDETYRCNKKIVSIKLSDKVVRYCNYFGVLQFLMMENKPSVIALAIIKFQLTSLYKNDAYSNIISVKQENIERNKKRNNSIIFPAEQVEKFINNDPHFMMVASKLIGDRFVFTNPGFFTPIEKDDIVLVLGDIDQEDFNKNFLQKQKQQSSMKNSQKSTQYSNNFVQNKYKEKSLNDKQKDQNIKQEIVFKKQFNSYLKNCINQYRPGNNFRII